MVLLQRAARAALMSLGLSCAPFAYGVASEQYQCYEGDATVCAIEGAVFKYTNEFRVQNRLVSLKFGQFMGFAARDWSRRQLASGGISHDGFPDARDLAIKAKFGPNGKALVLAENVAQNFTGRTLDETGKALVTQWIESAPHRQNLLGNYGVIGVGVALSGSTVIGTQIFGDEK